MVCMVVRCPADFIELMDPWSRRGRAPGYDYQRALDRFLIANLESFFGFEQFPTIDEVQALLGKAYSKQTKKTIKDIYTKYNVPTSY